MSRFQRAFAYTSLPFALCLATHARTYDNVCGDGVVTDVAPLDGACVGFTPAVAGGPDNWEVQEGRMYVMTISGVSECAGDTITVFVQSSESGNFCFDATGANGIYSGIFTVPDPACHTMPVSYKCGSGADCVHGDSFRAQGPSSGCGGVHLRASNFDASCDRTGTDGVCGETCPDPATAVPLGAPCPAVLTITPPVQGGSSTASYDGDQPGAIAFFLYSQPGTPFMMQGCEIFLGHPVRLGATVLLDGNGDGQVTVSNNDHPCGQNLVVQAFVVGSTGIVEASNGVLLTFGF